MIVRFAAFVLSVAWAVGTLVLTPKPASAGNALTVPVSIDSTGASDTSEALAEFIAAAPDGSTISFATGGIYRLDSGLRLIDRHGLTFQGNGATLRATATSGEPRTSPFLLEGGSALVISDFMLVGVNPDGGTEASHHLDAQDQGGINAYGVQGLVIERTTIRETWGDCVYLGSNDGSWSDGVAWRDSACERNGRMGIAVAAARNVVVERVRFDAIALSPFDIEPSVDSQGAIGIEFRDNTVGTYGHSTLFTPWFFAADGAAGAIVRDVSVVRNRVTGGTLASSVTRPNRSNFTFSDNVSLVPADGPVLYLDAVRDLTVTGNVQPLASGELVAVPLLHRAALAAVGLAILVLVALALIAVRRRRGTRGSEPGRASRDRPATDTDGA